jgi:uncharacterized protein YbjT (DUF2867 family)
MKTALIIGATGLVGSKIVRRLNDSKFYSRVILLVRRKSDFNHLKFEECLIDFDNIDPESIKGDDVFCAIGTTIKKAGSKENQYKIDCEYPYKIAHIAKQNGAKQFILVSSIGADYNSSNFYLRTKGELEKKISELNFETFIILRPSIILGKRNEFRLGETIGVFFITLFSPLFFGSLKKYKGVRASAIASRMVIAANQNLKGKHIIESDKI